MTIVTIQFLILFLAMCIFFVHGKPPQKILNGEEVRNAPYQVLIEEPYLTIHCGGVIIDAIHILTCAHCIVDGNGNSVLSDESRVLVGVLDVEYPLISNVYEIASVKAHESYNPKFSLHNDIGILKLDRAIKFTKDQKPIPLPVSDTIERTIVMATGWGTTQYDPVTLDVGPESNALRRSLEQVISQEECQKMLSDEIIHSEQICSWSAGRTTACWADSGGALIDGTFLVGLISFNQFCNASYPTVYTRVYSYVDWIKTVTNSL